MKRCRCIAGMFCALCVGATIAVETFGEAKASHPDTINANISVLTFQSSTTGSSTVSSFSHVTQLSGKVDVVYGEHDYIPIDRRTPDTPFLSTTPASTANFDQLKQRAPIFKLE